MNPNRRSFIGLLSALPVVGDKIAAAAMAELPKTGLATGTMMVREVTSSEDKIDYIKKPVEAIKRFRKDHLQALNNLLQMDESRMHGSAIDIDLAHNRSMSLAGIYQIQMKRNRERQIQADLLQFKITYGFDFNRDNPRETLERIRSEFHFEDRWIKKNNEKYEYSETEAIEDSSYI